MFDEELLNPEKIDGERKKEIAMVAQVEVHQVNLIIKQFEHMKGIHSWVRDMKTRGETMPDNQEDLFYRYRRDKPIRKVSFYPKLVLPQIRNEAPFLL